MAGAPLFRVALSYRRLSPYNGRGTTRAWRGVAVESRISPLRIRTSNVMIGTTALVVIAAAFLSLLGVRKYHSVAQRSQMRIVFEGSASGLRKGGNVNFDGVQVGEIVSLKLENPRKIVVLVRVDTNAPIRKDTVVGLEFQGLTGLAAISLTGGAPSAPPVPLDTDGVPVLTADLSEIQSIRDTLHNVDRILVGNQATIKDALLGFETYSASLAGSGEEIEKVVAKADLAFAGFNSAMAKIDNITPGLAEGKVDELFEKMREIREFAETFNRKSAVVIEEGRRTLLHVSQSAIQMTHKLNPQASDTDNPPPPRKPNPKRQ